MTELTMPAMSPARIEALATGLKSAKVYLEFGMGGSTILAARLGVPNIFAVDSSLDWVNHVASQISKIDLAGQVKLLHADLGPVGDWGYPESNNKLENWPGYYSGPWSAIHTANVTPDLVLIDGRFRVACFLYSLLNLKEGSIILWDDYLKRTEYHCVERFIRPIEFHDEMAMFEITEQTNVPRIVDALFSRLHDLD